MIGESRGHRNPLDRCENKKITIHWTVIRKPGNCLGKDIIQGTLLGKKKKKASDIMA